MIFYEGPSMLDGMPIIGIATGFGKGSNNSKTGKGLIQTWILRSDVSPIDAVHNGADESICGNCPHRGIIENGRNKNRSCYVTVFQAPLVIWKAYKRGIYPHIDESDLPATFKGLGVRLGAYGDPAAIPFPYWESMISKASFHTGYTHQWRDYPEFNALCMASADNETDKAHANALGFRTFRVRSLSEPVLDNEVVCPASAEMNHKLTCDQCKACSGLGGKARADIVIAVHGAKGKINHFENRR